MPQTQSLYRLIDAFPWSRQTTFYLIDFIIKSATDLLMTRDIEGGAALYRTEKVRVNQTGYRDWINGWITPDGEQAFFRIAHNAAVFVDSHVTFDQNDQLTRGGRCLLRRPQPARH